MVYDVENLFTLRPERPTLPQAPARKARFGDAIVC